MSGRLPTRSRVTEARLGVPVLGGLCLALFVGRLLPTDVVTHWAFHPAVVTGVCWTGQCWFAVRHLEPPWQTLLGIANSVTLLRGGLYAVVAGFVVVPPTTGLVWIPALCYGAGAVLDRLDGLVARSVGEQTDLGTRLDMAFDTFGFVAAPLVAVLWGRLPAWYLALSAARYVYLGTRYWRRRRGNPVYDSPDSNLGKYMAGVQMVFLTGALAPVVPTEFVWTIAPLVLAASLSVFARDYLVISGRLPLESSQS